MLYATGSGERSGTSAALCWTVQQAAAANDRHAAAGYMPIADRHSTCTTTVSCCVWSTCF